MMRMSQTQSGRESGPGGRGTAAAEGGGREGGGREGGGREGAGRGGRGGREGAAQGAGREGGRGARGGGGDTPPDAPAQEGQGGGGGEQGEGGRGAAGRGATAGSGRGGSQPREWYRGIPIPPGAAQHFSRRNNTNYMQTGVLSGLQLTSMFPNLVVENFYRKTQNSIEAGKNEAPYGYVIPVQRDMTRVAALVNLLRVQRIEVGQATARDQDQRRHVPGRLVRDQARPAVRPAGQEPARATGLSRIPTSAPTTTAAGRWAWRCIVDVKEIKDKAILDVPTTPVTEAAAKGKVTGTGTAGLAVAHFGSNNMIAFRYKLQNVPMKVAEKSFTADGVELPGRLVHHHRPGRPAAVRAAVEELGLTAAALSSRAVRADARRRRAARRDLHVVERHAGDRLGPLHASTSSASRSI